MPRRDRTGPWGRGPNTGRGLGPCVEDRRGNGQGRRALGVTKGEMMNSRPHRRRNAGW